MREIKYKVGKLRKKRKHENQKIKKLHYVKKGKLILSPKDQCQGPRFKVSSKGPSPEIHILIQVPVQVLTEAAVG